MLSKTVRVHKMQTENTDSIQRHTCKLQSNLFDSQRTLITDWNYQRSKIKRLDRVHETLSFSLHLPCNPACVFVTIPATKVLYDLLHL